MHDTSCFLCFIVLIFYLCFQVMYQSDQFLDKNKDYVVAEHQDLLSASKCLFVSGLFPPIPEETTKSSKFSSIGSRFKVPFSFPFFYRSSYPRGQFLAPTRWVFDSVKGKPNPICSWTRTKNPQSTEKYCMITRRRNSRSAYQLAIYPLFHLQSIGNLLKPRRKDKSVQQQYFIEINER